MARPRGSRKERRAEKRMATGGGVLIGYVRVSTQDQGDNGHSLDGQRTRLQEAAEAAGYQLLDVVSDIESGAKRRENLEVAQARIDAGEAEGLIFPKLDRLGRSQIHLAELVQWAQDNGVTLLSADEGLMVERGALRNEALPFLIALAQVERERISRRTKEGLAAARAKGVRLGAPAENVGELSERALHLRREGATVQAIADTFNAEGHRTARGRQFRPMTVYRMINRLDPTANPEGGYKAV